MTDKLNIYQRINAVMQEVAYIKKDASVSGAGANYKAVTHDQVVSVTRSLFVKHGIVIYPEQVGSEMIQQRDLKQDIKMHLYSGTYIINFVNIDDPQDRVPIRINAHAADNGDKAPGKCITYATKSAILKLLNLETGENEESREEVREKQKVITPEQYQQLAEYCLETDDNGSLRYSQIGQKMVSAYRINVLEELPSGKFEEALKRCQKAAGGTK